MFIKGGVLRSAAGRSTLWRDGRVAWESADNASDGGSTNVGTTPIEMIWVRLKQAPATVTPASAAPRDYHLGYPNIPGEDLLENDRLVVQRFVVKPGQWEGVHAHRPNMLYIHVKGGQWGERTYKQPEHSSGPLSADGSVGWMRIVDIGEGHESRTSGLGAHRPDLGDAQGLRRETDRSLTDRSVPSLMLHRTIAPSRQRPHAPDSRASETVGVKVTSYSKSLESVLLQIC